MTAPKSIAFHGVLQDGDGLVVIGYGSDPVAPVAEPLKWFPGHRQLDAEAYAAKLNAKLESKLRSS